MPPVGIVVAGLVFSALASVGVGAAAAGIIAGITGIIAVIGASMLPGLVIGGLNKLFSKGPIDPGRSVNVRQPNAARRTIYGHCRIGGTITMVHLSPRGDSPNNDLHIIYTLSGHPLHAFSGMLINGKAVSFGSVDGTPQPFPGHNVGYRPGTGTYSNNLWAQWRLGNLGDTLFTGLSYATAQDGSNLWTTAHRQDGCGAIEVLLTWNTNIYPNGVPPVLFDVSGKEFFDFRDNSTGYSENPALAAYDYLTNKEYGMGADTSEINVASFTSAANTCDENVALKAGGFENRYKINGTFAWDSQPADVLKAIANCMAGFIAYSQGQWTCIAGVYGSPSLHLTDDDLRAPTKIQTLRSKRDLCNGVRGTIFSPLRNWQKVDFPPVYHPEHVCDDSGFPNATQTGAWAAGTVYAANDAATDISARSIKGTWVTATAYVINDWVSNAGSVYVCILNHTSGSISQPGVGGSYTTYWVDVTPDYAAAIGAIYVCFTPHTSQANNRPGRGAYWVFYWKEAKELIWKDLDLPFTISSPTAQRIAKIELERVRRQISIVLPCKMTAFQIQPGDIFYYSHPRFGWVDKTFQAMQTNFVVEQGQEGAVIGIDVYANEIDAAVFAWDPATEEQALGTPAQPTMPDSEVPGRDFFVYGPGMTYTSTTTAVHWFWDYTGGNAIILLDNQNTQFTPSGGQNVTGLTTNTHYLWYPYYDRILGDISFLILFTTGIGTPPWAQSSAPSDTNKRGRIAEWQRDGHLPLALNPIDAATTASGGGGGGGGGDGGCLRIGMFVKEQTRGVIPCEQVCVGDYLWSETGFLSVVEKRIASHDLWCEIEFNNGSALTVTTGHPFTLAEDRKVKKASELCMEDGIPCPTGTAFPRSIRFVQEESQKVPITLEMPHTFFASSDGENWILTHNIGQPTT